LKAIKLQNSFNPFFRNELFLSLLVNILLFSLFFLAFTPFFETNDDYGMMQIASGYRYGEPTEYLVYLNVIWGFLLKFLYQNFPAANWYVILFYLVHFFSMTIILYIFLKKTRSLYSYLLFTLLFVFFEVFLLSNLQFTTTSMVAGCSGILLLISLVSGWRRTPWIIYFTGIVLQIISGMIRYKVYLLLLLLFVPVIFLLVVKKRTIRILFPFLIAVSIFGGFFAFHNAYYNRDPEWRYYLQYNALRGQITDFRYTRYNENTQALYTAVGWSENDTNMIKGWFYLEQEKYTLDDLEFLAAQFGPEQQSWVDIQETVSKVFDDVEPRRFWFVVIISVISLAFCLKFEKLLLLSVIAGGFLACGYLIYSGRLPARILHSIIFSISAFSLYLLSIKHNHIHRNFWIMGARESIIFSGIVIYLLVIGSAIFADLRQNISRIEEEKTAGINNIIQELSTQDYIYAIAPAYLKNKNLEITFANNHPPKLKEINFGGWAVPSPYFTRELELYGLTSSYLELMRDDILTLARPSALKAIKEYIKENHGLIVNFYPVISVSDFTAYEIVKAAIPFEPSGVITENKPVYQWSPDESAELYQVQILRGTTVIKDQWVRDLDSACSGNLCTEESAIKLSAGDYQWRVRPNVNDTWQSWSEYVDFSIVDP
jgi:hypothetical protein